MRLIVYGPSGVGKTSLAANFPDVGFIYDPKEQGIEELVAFGQCPDPVFKVEAPEWDSLLTLVRDAAMGRLGAIQFLALDSLTGMQNLCFQYHCRKYFKDDWSDQGFMAFHRGPVNAAQTDWPELLESLDICVQRGITPVILGHSQVKPFNNPMGADYDRFIADSHKEIWSQTHKWASAILFYSFDADIKKEGLKKKADQSTERRMIYTQHSPAYDAKNRFGLSPAIDAGDSGESAFAALKSCFQKALK